MRVLFLASYFPKPQNPAMGVWALREADQLLALGNEVRVVSLTSWLPRWLGSLGIAKAWSKCPKKHAWGNLEAEYPRWPFYQVGVLKTLWYRRPGLPLSLGALFALPNLRRIVESWQPDVIFAHHGAVNGYLAAKLHKASGVPFVVKDYDFGEIEDCRRYAGRRAVYREVCRSAATMVSAANRMRDEMLAQFPGTNVVTHHNGADSIPTEILSNPRPADLADKLVISSTGIFYERKNFPLLVRAFGRIAQQHPNAVLRICGDGPERPRIESAIQESGAKDRITLLGMQPHKSVLQEMVWADVFALVGWDEPFATVYLEAAAAGKPIVCCDDGGINDVLVNGQHGITVPPHDEAATAAALERLIADGAFRRDCAENLMQLFQTDLCWSVAAKRLDEILRAAAQRG